MSGSPHFRTHGRAYFMVVLYEVWLGGQFWPTKYEQKWHAYFGAEILSVNVQSAMFLSKFSNHESIY